jgi:hypothetical protein
MIQIGTPARGSCTGAATTPCWSRRTTPARRPSPQRYPPTDPAPVTPIESGLRQDSVLLIGTDGFGDPLGDGDGKVRQLFAGHLASPPAARGLAHLLDFSRETFDDDRTLVALWPRAVGGGAAR